MCNVNDFAVNYLCQSLPFGGVNVSGFDRFAGPEGLRGNCLVRVSARALQHSAPPSPLTRDWVWGGLNRPSPPTGSRVCGPTSRPC
jgi:hypothetical protein